jgi:nickel-dependent lactate racemase
MKLDVPYGKETVPLEVPDDAEVVYPNEVEGQDEGKVLAEALANPITSKNFGAFLADARDVLFIVNDATRPTPTARRAPRADGGGAAGNIRRRVRRRPR